MLPPTIPPNEDVKCKVYIPAEWLPIIRGLVLPMLSEEFWAGTKAQKDTAQLQAEQVFTDLVGCNDEN